MIVADESPSPPKRSSTAHLFNAPSSLSNRARCGGIALGATILLYFLINTAFAQHIRNVFEPDVVIAVVSEATAPESSGASGDVLTYFPNGLLKENAEKSMELAVIDLCDSENKKCRHLRFKALAEIIASWPVNYPDGWSNPPEEACDLHFVRVDDPKIWVERILDSIAGVRISDHNGLIQIYEVVPQGGLNGRNPVYRWTVTDRPIKPDAECTGLQERYARMDAVIRGLLDELRSEVSWSRWWLRAFNGKVQFIIVFCAIWILALTRCRQLWLGDFHWIVGRPAKTGELADPTVRVRQYLDGRDRVFDQWLMNALPLLGFIGTVIGMIGAMKLIGTVVSAEAGPQLENQVGLLAGQLSIAFYTTFLALGANLLLSLYQDSVFAAELHGAIEVVALEEAAADEARGPHDKHERRGQDEDNPT